MRKLASIQRIIDLKPIPDADNIDVATILGWKVVVKRGDFQTGDLCIYCEIDSVFPDKPEYEFLRKINFRIKTIRLRGQISQGICFKFCDIPGFFKNFYIPTEDDDVTELLGITKYEVPVMHKNFRGIPKGIFPSFIPKTDEPRVQILQDVISNFKGHQCYITEKLDGCSATYYVKAGVFGVCSRNQEIKEGHCREYLVPFRKYFLLDDNIEKLVEMATIKSAINPDVWAEGIVIRSINNEVVLDKYLSKNLHNRMLSFKVINPEFLLKHKE